MSLAEFECRKETQRGLVRVCGVLVVWINTHGNPSGNSGQYRRIADKEKKMTHSMKDKIKGTLHEVKGSVKEKMGQVTSNPSLTAKGKSEKLAGKLQRKIGEIENVLEQ